MKKTHQPPNIIINETELVGAKDVKGFCDAMFKPLVIFGVLAVAYGVVGFINDKYMEISMVNFASIVVFLAACVWFLRLTKKHRTTYIK
jgi:membrane associated rhomboid family serine protease